MQTAILLTLTVAHLSLSFATPFLSTFHIHPLSRSQTCPVQLQQDPPALRTLSTRQHHIQMRIVNGDDASENLLPYLVAIVNSNGFVCTGSLISSRWVLTAAHCNVSVNDTALIALRRPLATTASTSHSVPISEVFVHEDYNQGRRRRYDIAAIQLSQDAPVVARPMQVNVNGTIPVTRSFVRVLGYGRTSETETSSQREPVLRQVDVPVMPGDICREIHPRVSPELQVCAGYEEGGCDSCKGDSGGPMVQYNDQGEAVLVGIVSSGTGCARPGFPGIYIRAAAFAEWLDALPGMAYRRTMSTRAILQPMTSSKRVVIGIAAGVGVAVALVIALAIVVVIRSRRSRKLSRKESAKTDEAVAEQDIESEAKHTPSRLPAPLPPVATVVSVDDT